MMVPSGGAASDGGGGGGVEPRCNRCYERGGPLSLSSACAIFWAGPSRICTGFSFFFFSATRPSLPFSWPRK